jgi:sugar phosphate isomerase/epimerase
MKLTLGCTTRPFQNAPFDEACKRIAAAGYTDVAVFYGIGPDTDPETVAEMREAALAAGVEPSMLMARVPHDLEAPAEYVAAYKAIIDNAVILGADWLLELGTHNEAFYDDYIDVMRQVAPYAEEKGIQMTLKPHGGITTTTADLLSVYERVGHPAYTICYDPGNIIYYTKGNERPKANIAKVAPMTDACIIKDCVLDDEGNPDVMITPGEGLVDFEAVLGALAAASFDGPLYVECLGGDTDEEIDENAARTVTFLEDILARISG